MSPTIFNNLCMSIVQNRHRQNWLFSSSQDFILISFRRWNDLPTRYFKDYSDILRPMGALSVALEPLAVSELPKVDGQFDRAYWISSRSYRYAPRLRIIPLDCVYPYCVRELRYICGDLENTSHASLHKFTFGIWTQTNRFFRFYRQSSVR